MNHKELQAALEWQLKMGVTESFSDKPRPQMADIVIPSKAEEYHLNKRDSSTPLRSAQNDRSFNEPSVNYKKEEMPKKPDIKIVATNTANSEFLNMSSNEWVKKARHLADNAKNLAELKAAIEGFDGLAIKKSATNTVFGDGNPKSAVMLIGEAPGENEDLEGRPFCGLSGQLLDKMLRFIGLEREKNFYITNTLFWRPPGNRKPTPEELAICKPFVEKHIALIAPKVMILVGGTATLGVLNSKDSISLMRKVITPYNNVYTKEEIPCFAIYHPSYLLRSPSQKKNAWADMIKIKKYLHDITA